MASYQPRKHPSVLDLSFFKTTNAPKLIISFWIHLAMPMELSGFCGFKVEGRKLFSSFRNEKDKKKKKKNIEENYKRGCKLTAISFFLFSHFFHCYQKCTEIPSRNEKGSHFHHFWACQGTLDVFDGLGVKDIDSSGVCTAVPTTWEKLVGWHFCLDHLPQLIFSVLLAPKSILHLHVI